MEMIQAMNIDKFQEAMIQVGEGLARNLIVKGNKNVPMRKSNVKHSDIG